VTVLPTTAGAPIAFYTRVSHSEFGREGTAPYLGWMFRQRDDVLDLLEALGKVLRRVVVAMWLGVPI
jgi:hypothetical protein